MKAVVLRELGDPERLRLEEVADPEPGPDEVRVRLRAAALNHRDLWIRIGRYAGIELPVILGSDGAGVVDAVGADVDEGWVGREVIIDPSLDWGPDARVQDPRTYHILGMPRDGTYAEACVVSAAQVHPKPAHLDFEEAAALPLAGMTAWRALVTRGRVASGERMLVTGAGGGVAAMAVLWGAALGAEVWVTSSSEAKIEAAMALGACGGVDYRRDGWPADLRARAGGDFDLIIDGAVGPGFADLVGLAAYAGRVVVYGATAGVPSDGFPPARLFWRQLEIRGSTMATAPEFAEMLAFCAEKRLTPPVDRVFPLSEAAEAHRHMAAAGQAGKIVLRMPAGSSDEGYS